MTARLAAGRMQATRYYAWLFGRSGHGAVKSCKDREDANERRMAQGCGLERVPHRMVVDVVDAFLCPFPQLAHRLRRAPMGMGCGFPSTTGVVCSFCWSLGGIVRSAMGTDRSVLANVQFGREGQ